MSNVHNSVDTVNAAATAIVTAESRVQPSTVQVRVCVFLLNCSLNCPERRWVAVGASTGVLVLTNIANELVMLLLFLNQLAPGAGVAAPVSESWEPPSTLVMPFIAPPSLSCFLSAIDPSSATQSPAGVLSLASLSVHAQSLLVNCTGFQIGPYAHETHYPGSPGGHLKSPGSAMSTLELHRPSLINGLLWNLGWEKHHILDSFREQLSTDTANEVPGVPQKGRERSCIRTSYNLTRFEQRVRLQQSKGEVSGEIHCRL
ncbi:hypothetical protein SASPL_110752 [Salvia splendens]|uniref:Uncharacterized protein n=1 Tax=Salvia splendens TaxID=180675 RepID=A0A8X9A1R7_SALSN|nr:hypothetical protein SASPL_110752 [Salvia splendens]